MGIWNFWARHHRNARALGAGVAIFGAIFAMSLLRCNPMIERVEISGVVLAVEAENLRPLGEGEPQARVLVAAEDSVQIRLFLPPPVPKIGDKIPLIAEHYKKGDSLYHLDQQKWRLTGPQ